MCRRGARSAWRQTANLSRCDAGLVNVGSLCKHRSVSAFSGYGQLYYQVAVGLLQMRQPAIDAAGHIHMWV